MSEKTCPDNVFLVVAQSLIPLDKTVMNLGRHPQNDIIIADPTISRFHARIECVDGEFVVSDLDSTFGTKVNDETIEQHKLQNGDTISLGNTPCLFIDRSASDVAGADKKTGMLHDTADD